VKEFIEEIAISFHCIDGAGILFFGHIFTLAHEVYENFVTQGLKLPWDDWFNNQTWAVPIKSTDACFHAPLLGGRKCLVYLSVERVGNSSFTLQFQFFQDEKHCSTVKTTHVFLSKQARKTMPLPPPVLRALKEYSAAPCQEKCVVSAE